MPPKCPPRQVLEPPGLHLASPSDHLSMPHHQPPKLLSPLVHPRIQSDFLRHSTIHLAPVCCASFSSSLFAIRFRHSSRDHRLGQALSYACRSSRFTLLHRRHCARWYSNRTIDSGSTNGSWHSRNKKRKRSRHTRAGLFSSIPAFLEFWPSFSCMRCAPT